MNAIECQNLSKAYRRGRYAVANLNLRIEPKQVYGFLGPNGAGKTTTIRLILDLIRPTQGRVLLFGQPVYRNAKALRQVGMLVEGANFYPYLNGWTNLEVLGRTLGEFDPQRAQMLLEMVGLHTEGKKRVGKYSMGMKQRLGIAAALLHDPQLLILDEPTNGLDPAGIHEMRGLIRRLVDEEGKTVFFSSHLLGEVQQICDRVAIIHHGQLLAEDSVARLLAQHAMPIVVQAAPLDRAATLLQERWQVRPGSTPDTLMINAAQTEIPEIVRALVAAEIDVCGIQAQQPSLEALFLSMTEQKPDVAVSR